jgi:uncharacterized protein
MIKRLFILVLIFTSFSAVAATNKPAQPIRVLIITGGHDFKVGPFKQMFESFGKDIQYEIAELPAAYDKFLPANRKKYDVLVFYHMWQDITPEQAKNLSECISQGKPLVVLHHSICAYDDWPEYLNITGGRYFHKPTIVKGKEYPVCSYIHDLHFKVRIVDTENPVTKGLNDFEIFDETYKGFYVDEGVTPLLTTEEPSSTPVIGWSKTYGKSRVVTLQSGHDVATYENPYFRKILRQAIEWVYDGI